MMFPRERGGWWHNYVCPVHHVELTPPACDGFPCPYGCALYGEPYASGWRAVAHQRAARQVRLRARRGDHTAGALLDEYAEIYNELAQCGWSDHAEPWMVRGKLFAQAMSEAQWAAQIADAVLACERATHSRAVVRMLEGLLETVTEARRVLVEERADLRNNYTAWLDCAGAMVSRALGVSAGIDIWRQGLADHIAVAVGSDGWEWEGSTYYHVFVLRAYLLNLRDMKPVDVPADVAERIAEMLRGLIAIAAPDGALPALHDSPYRRVDYLREVVEVCVLGRQFVTVAGLERIESQARTALGVDDDGLEQHLDGWFDGPPLDVPDIAHAGVYSDAGLVVLRNPSDTIVAMVDTGVPASAHGSHRHASQLALYLYGAVGAWQPPPGVPPYASHLRRDFYAQPRAHPAVRVDDMAPNPAPAHVELDGQRVVVETGELYPGVTLRRSVEVTHDGLVDVVTAWSADEHTYVLGMRPGGEFSARRRAADVWRTSWQAGRLVLAGVHMADQPTTLEGIPGRGPADDPSRPHLNADWSYRGRAVTFASVYRTEALAETDWNTMIETATGALSWRMA